MKIVTEKKPTKRDLKRIESDNRILNATIKKVIARTLIPELNKTLVNGCCNNSMSLDCRM